MARSGIILGGIMVLDIVKVITRWPDEETICFIQKTEHAAGGPPNNAAAGLLKLGAPFPVTLMGVAGDDHYGDLMLASARSYGVDTAAVTIIPGAVTSHTYVMSSAATGRRTFFVEVGVNNLLKVEHLRPRASNAKLYYLGSPTVAGWLDANDGWRTLLKAARDDGMATCMELCPSPAEAINRLVTPCLPLVDYLIVNDYEAESLTGLGVVAGPHFDWRKADAACRRLLDLGVGRLAVIHHPDGAMAVARSGEVASASSVKVPASEIAGAVGAGDAFYAGMLFGIHEDWPLAQCLALANAAAATSLQSPTTSASIRPWAECLAYAREHGLRDTANPGNVTLPGQ
jgi:sugar/nucleoside kinase (ribokinase family)